MRLQITAPADGATRARAGPPTCAAACRRASSAVTVLGRPALVTDGRFTVVVPLEPGINVIDVMATAPRRLPAMTALRVTRDVLVTVPELTGLLEDELDARLEPLGLRADVERGGGLFDVLRPGEPRVCEQEPRAGDAGAARARGARRGGEALLSCVLAQSRGRDGDQRDPRAAAVAHDAEHDLALDRGAAPRGARGSRRSRGRRRRRVTSRSSSS